METDPSQDPEPRGDLLLRTIGLKEWFDGLSKPAQFAFWFFVMAPFTATGCASLAATAVALLAK